MAFARPEPIARDLAQARLLQPASPLPPLLAPAAAAFIGAGLGWLRPDYHLAVLPALLLVWVLLVRRHRVRQVAKRQMAGLPAKRQIDNLPVQRCERLPLPTWLLAIACWLLAFLQAVALVRSGLEAQAQLAGGIHRQSGEVLWIISTDDPARDEWGRAAVRLEGGAVCQLSGAIGPLLPGQRIDFQARFLIPQGRRNPGGFDERLYLARDSIFLKAELFLGRISLRDARADPAGTMVLRLQAALARAARAILPPDEAALLLGVLVGDTSRMDASMREAFQLAGLSHLTAVSGANVSFLMAPAALLLRRLLRRRNSRSIGLVLFVVAFGFLTGWEASVTRAIVMAGLALAGKLLMRRSDPLNALLFAATAMLLARPLLAIAQPFHLSFLATAGIFLASERLMDMLRRWLPALPPGLAALLALNLSVQVTVLPLQTLVSGAFSPLSLLANLPALPLAEGATLLGAAALLPALLLLPFTSGRPVLMTLLRAVAWPVRILLQALARLAVLFADEAWPRVLTGHLTPLFLVSLALLPACLIVRSTVWRDRLKRAGAVVCAAACVVQAGAFLTQPDLEIWMLDVGQGDAMLIRARDGTVTLIDGGTELAGKSIVRPALQALGIRKLTQAVVTHGHADHAGGLLPLLAAGQVRRLVLPHAALIVPAAADGTMPAAANGLEEDVLPAVLDLAGRRHIPVQGAQKGDTIPVGSGAALTVLAPEVPESQARAARSLRQRGANAANLVLRLTAGRSGWSMLLMGDCDRETEQALLRSGQPLTADALRVAHHGSGATTGESLLDAVSPHLALISVGRNDYGHPAPAVLERLAGQTVPVVRTDRQGAVAIRVYRQRSTVTTSLAMTAK